MINRLLRDKFIDAGILKQMNNENIIMHDWWLALIASTFGKIIHIDDSLVFYRQHTSNTLGAESDLSTKFTNIISKKGISKIISEVKNTFDTKMLQSTDFYNIYLNNLKNNEMKEFLEKYINHNQMTFLEKINFLNTYKFHRLRKRSMWMFDLMYLFSA